MARLDRSGRRRDRRRGRAASGVPGFVWGLLLAAVLAAVGVIIWIARENQISRERIDIASSCDKSGASRALLMLLDTTDSLSPVQRKFLQRNLDERINALPTGTLVAVGMVAQDPSAQGAAFWHCVPQRGKDVSAATANPAAVEQFYQSQFRQPLQQAIDRGLTAQPQDASPIMESLQALVAGVPRAAGTDLLIVSDMLQHSDVLSIYRGEDWTFFKSSGAAARSAGSLNGANVTIVSPPRKVSPAQQAKAEDFWVRYFVNQGAGQPRIETLGDL